MSYTLQKFTVAKVLFTSRPEFKVRIMNHFFDNFICQIDT